MDPGRIENPKILKNSKCNNAFSFLRIVFLWLSIKKNEVAGKNKTNKKTDSQFNDKLKIDDGSKDEKRFVINQNMF